MAEIERTLSGNRGKCTNCERDNLFIASKDGHCCTCKTAVKDLTSGSQEYVAALAAVKERLTKPHQKRPVKQPTRPVKKPAASTKTISDLPAVIKKDQGKRRQVVKAALALKKDKETTALDLLVAEQVWLTCRLGKVNQAIDILS